MKTIIAKYDYIVDGVVINTKCKYSDKSYYWEIQKADGGQCPIYNGDILKTAIEVVIAEGEKDCDTLKAIGIPAIAFPYGAVSVPEEQIPLLMHLKKIYVAYDNDDAGIKGCNKIIAALKKESYSGQIYVINWGEGKKSGYDVADWFNENTGDDKVERFYGLFAEYKPTQALIEPEKVQNIESVNVRIDPNPLLTIATSLSEIHDIRTIYGQLHRKEGHIYVPFEDHRQVRKIIIEYLCEHGGYRQTRKQAIEEIVYLLESLRVVPAKQVNPESFFPVQNGYLTINHESGKVELLDLNNLAFTFVSQLEYKDHDTTKIDEFLSLVIPDEKEQNHILEALAFVLFPGLRNRVNFDDFIFILGAGDNGKSILVESVIEPIVGSDTVCHISYKDLEDKFCLAQIIGKRLNTATENDVVYVSENDKIKAIASGAKQQTRQIYSKAISTKIFCVLMFCVNKELEFSATLTKAMTKRIKLVHCPNTFTDESTDPKFKADASFRDINDIKVKELQQGMLVKLVKTVERLYRDKELTKANLSIVEERQKEASHIKDFVDQFYIFDKAWKLSWETVFRRDYQDRYCEQNNIFNPGKGSWSDPHPTYDRAARNASQLSRKLRQLFPGKVILEKSNSGRFVIGLKPKNG